jgi:hypothetical protein
VEFPHIVELNDKYSGQGVSFVSINTGPTSGAVKAYLEEQGASHFLLNDTEGDVARSYRVMAIPLTVLVDHEGRAVYRHLGFGEGDEERLEKEIETLLTWTG